MVARVALAVLSIAFSASSAMAATADVRSSDAVIRPSAFAKARLHSAPVGCGYVNAAEKSAVRRATTRNCLAQGGEGAAAGGSGIGSMAAVTTAISTAAAVAAATAAVVVAADYNSNKSS